jgi:hypothetical protein
MTLIKDMDQFKQNARVVEETMKRIKDTLPMGDTGRLERLVIFLDMNIKKQNSLLDFATQDGGNTGASSAGLIRLVERPKRSTDESHDAYSARLETSFDHLSRIHTKTLSELEYHRQCHRACHDEVHRLRKILRTLEKSLAASGILHNGIIK